ncbi:hypothetical protein [Mycobacterium sp. URHB0021]
MALVWGYATLSWFIVAEMALTLFAATVPRRVMPWAAAVIPGSVLGVLTNAGVAARDVLLPAPLTTPRMAAAAFNPTDQWPERHDAPSVFGHSGKGVCPRRRRALHRFVEPCRLDATGAWAANFDGGTGRLAAVVSVSTPAATPLRVSLIVGGIVFTTSIWAILTAWS